MANKTREQNFKELSDRDHVRLRTSVYLGSMSEETFNGPIFSSEAFTVGKITFIPALVKAFNEIVDNAVDELTSIKRRNKCIDITVDEDEQTITVADNGSGIPLDKRSNGRYRPEVALSTLRAGSNFDDDKKTAGIIGTNGVGSACTNMCSTHFEVTIHRDNKVYRQVFLDGTNVIKDPTIKADSSGKTGTSITFTPDPTVFGHDELPMVALRNRAYEVAIANPDITVTFNGEKIRYKKGLTELADEISDDYFMFTDAYDDGTSFQFIVVPNYHTSRTETMLTWVNSSLLYDGGICNTQFLNAFTDKVIKHLETRAKRAKIVIDKDDVTRGLLVLGNLKLIAPSYDSQAKTRLKGPSTRKQVDAMIEEQWAAFLRKNKTLIESVFQTSYDRYHRKANAKAVEQHQKSAPKIEGMLEASNADRSKCILFVTEGDSARANIRQVRDPKLHAALPMSGKINNVHGATVAQVLAMPKVADLLKAVNLTPGKIVDPYLMRYGQIVLAMDADTDGSHIVTLFTKLLYQFWPELFNPENPKVFRLVTPNVVAYKGKERVHFPTAAEFQAVESKYANWSKKYMKGLGTLTIDDWKMVLADLDKNCLAIVDDGNLKETLDLHFGDDVEWRKAWLMGEL